MSEILRGFLFSEEGNEVYELEIINLGRELYNFLAFGGRGE